MPQFMFANTRGFGFKLRTLLIGFAVVAVACAALRMALTQTVSLRIWTSEDCLVYLDDRLLGRGTFTLNSNEALELGFPWEGEIRYEWRPHGLFLLDMQDETGRAPLLHLRPTSGNSSSLRTVFLDGAQQKQAILLSGASIIDRRIAFKADDPLPKNQLERAVSLVEERVEGGTKTFVLRVTVVPEIQRAIDSQEGFRLRVNASSLLDGRSISQYRTLLPANQENGEFEVNLQVPLRASDEQFLLYFGIDGHQKHLFGEEEWRIFQGTPLPVHRAQD